MIIIRLSEDAGDNNDVSSSNNTSDLASNSFTMRNDVNKEDRVGDLYFSRYILESNTAGYTTIKSYIEAGQNVNYVSRHGDSLLHVAAAYSSASTVSSLLGKGVDVNVTDCCGNTPLTWACLEGRFYIVQLLLAAGADINIIGTHTGSLHAAAYLGNDEILSELLARGVKVDSQTTVTKTTALHAACSGNHENVVRMLIGSKASVTCKDYQGKTALDVATSPSIKQWLQNIIDNPRQHQHPTSHQAPNSNWSARVHHHHQQEQPESHHISFEDNIEIVAAMRRSDYAFFLDYIKVISNDLTIRCANGNTLLHEAALHLPPGAIDILVYHGLKVDDVNHAGETALMLACEKERVMVVEKLLAHGAKAADYRIGNDDATLLHIAVAKASKCIVRTLIRIGKIPVDIVDLNLNTPLMCACRTNHASEATLACIRLLIKLGADINRQQGKHYDTALHTAARDSRREQILKLLLAHPKTNVNVKNAARQTALRLACKAKNLTAVKLLLECGASLTKQERDGVSNECKHIISAYEHECQRLINAMSNNQDYVYNYVKRQGNVSMRIKGCSLLHIAAARADRDMMALLVNAGIPVNVRNTANETPLIVACRGNKDAKYALYLKS